jgi:3-deoxy-D-manno-octulosonate 8-phosphate phosphatase (KDO 8-P phosphatase)
MRPDDRVTARAARVELVIFDVDGVLTDGRIIIGADGAETKQFHVRDGLGMVMLRESGVEIAVITGRESVAVSRRMDELGIDRVFQGQSSKTVAFESVCDDLGIAGDAVCYVGDDLPDIPVMARSGLPIAVANANWKVQEFAAYITTLDGGAGAAREVCELIMSARGTLADSLARFAPVTPEDKINA